MAINELSVKIMDEIKHYPVMCKEAIELLDIKNKKFIVDCTVGVGSHALAFLGVMRPDAFLIGGDRDKESLEIASRRLKHFGERFTLIKGDFSKISSILETFHEECDLEIANERGVDVFFLDLGISTYQLNNPQRGFSFLKEGPLDMRMDRDHLFCAHDLVNNLSERELVNIFRQFGEERYAKRAAHAIIEARSIEPIGTTSKLTQIILRAVPYRSYNCRIHPATRIFQALRIAVNRELEVLEIALAAAVSFLNPGGRIGVISFHSLEDRIVKHSFKNFAAQGILKIITKKPARPGEEETAQNPASRSAKLRVAEKT